ncbi:MAG: hypothetical protein E6G22_04085 [Actinobacteria bacterium]|nr:MAG: hypothetical protein E6G22_04085 [Actinomycetota bacterium]
MIRPAIVAAVALGLSASSGATTTPSGYHVLLTSNRDGRPRGYSMVADGSRLTPLLPRGRTLVPRAVSRDGSRIVYTEPDGVYESAIYVSRADGRGLHQVVPKPARNGVLSPDGRLLAFTKRTPGIWIIGTDGRGARRLTRRNDGSPAWSPNGKTLAFVHAVGDFAGVLVVRPLHGRGRALAWGEFDGLEWSPNGRWIAYTISKDDPLIHDELWVVRPNGTSRHRVARDVSDLGGFAWSPDGRRLAFAVGYGNEVAVTGLDGRRRRLAFSRLDVTNLTWLPDRHLVLQSGYGQLWIAGLDGHGLRRLTREGANGLVGWTRLAPVRPTAPPLPKTERAVDRHTLALRARVASMAADGTRVAFVTGRTATDCAHVAVWTPAAGSVARPLPAPCGPDLDVLGSVALAGTRVAWSSASCCGHTTDSGVVTARLSQLDPPWRQVAEATLSDDVGTFVRGPAGDGRLLVFTILLSCDSNSSPGAFDACPPGYEGGDVASTTLWRLGGRGPCPSTYSSIHGCVEILKAEGKLDVLAVDAGRIVVGTKSGVEIVTAGGRVLRTFAVTAKAAALSGTRLAVETAGGVEIYDTASGRLVVQLPALKGLQDLEGDILVTASGSAVTLRRLGDGRTTTFHATGKARAQLERPGLFVAGDRRMTFTRMLEILRRLGG